MASEKFDLNSYLSLENWTISQALQEIISNALYEQKQIGKRERVF